MKNTVVCVLSTIIWLGCVNVYSLQREINALKQKNYELERRIVRLEQRLKTKEETLRQEEKKLKTILQRTSDLNNRYVELYKAINEVRQQLGLPSLSTPPKTK